ncbi:MAG: hypothetical protein ACR2L3_05685 [Actinomycetota bacterium]
MGREDAGRWLDVLDESFGAAIAAADESAADDLALSFLQDLKLTEALRRLGPIAAQVGADPFCAIAELGSDYVVTRDVHPRIVNMERVVFKSDPAGMGPVCRERSMVGLLRSLARKRVMLRVLRANAVTVGLLVRAGRDHLGLRTGEQEVLIPLGLVSAITLIEEPTWRF